MSAQHPAGELAAGYEALRAQAVGEALTDTPRGLALVLTQGLAVWIRAWATPPPAPALPPVAVGNGNGVGTGFGAEVVRVLTEMALGCRVAVVGP